MKSALDLVDMLARGVTRQLGSYADRDDLASYGHEALMTAARTFEPDRGVPFRRWAQLKIRGAMLESLRNRGPLPKRTYRKLRAMQAADQIYENAAEEDAAALAMSPETADRRLEETLASAAAAMALGLLHSKSTEELTSGLKDDEESPEELAARVEMVRVLREVIAERPDAERTLLERHYFDDLTVEEVAKEIGLSKSWACRLHARAIDGVARSLKRRRFESP
jgi:RNA polymerase sigma factor for flagellar operon FliA